MPSPKNGASIVISAVRARADFARLLQQVDCEQRSLVIAERGTPRAVLLSIRDYVKLAAPEPEVLTAIGREASRNGISRMKSGQIDRLIRARRSGKPKR
jgi:prevent-host-death family protein